MTIQLHATLLDPEVKKILTAMQAEIADLRTKLIATQTQLDGDGGVTGTTFTSANAPAALTITA